MEKVFSSRRVAILFLIVYAIWLQCCFFLFEYLWAIPFLLIGFFVVALIYFSKYLFAVKKRFFGVLLVICFISVSISSLPFYISLQNAIDIHIIIPRIEQLSSKLLHDNENSTVYLNGFNKLLSSDNTVHIKNNCAWFLQYGGDATSNSCYFVYDSLPDYGEHDYLTEHVYIENEDIP